jgi:hypothetical protein
MSPVQPFSPEGVELDLLIAWDEVGYGCTRWTSPLHAPCTDLQQLVLWFYVVQLSFCVGLFLFELL